MAKTNKKFKLVERETITEPAVEWEGEEVSAESKTQLTDDQGTGQEVVLRFFEFGANPEVFAQHKPTAQELFNSHSKGMESLLWRDGLRPYEAVEPRLMFSKDKTKYRFILACTKHGSLYSGNARTLTQLLKK